MARYQAIGLDKVKEITNNINRDLIESIVYYDNSVFDLFKINVITDIENADTVYQFMRKGNTTRLYNPNELGHSVLGYVSPRKLQVHLNYKRVIDNIQEYREKEPFSVLGTNNTYQFPNSEWRIRKIMEGYREDVLAALFFGDLDANEESGLKLYDGIYKLINGLVGSEITEANGNFINLDEPLMLKAAQDGDLWNAFVAAVDKLNPKLRNASELLCWIPGNFRTALIHDYMRYFTGMQTGINMNDVRFIGYENIKLVSHPIMGKADEEAGAKLIFTVAGNVDFGCDNRPEQSMVMVDKMESDFNKIIFQIQSAHGMRIRSVTPDMFAVTSGLNVPIDGLVGDYTKDTITLRQNIAEGGSVSVAPEKETYAKGESITLTAEAAEGYTFKGWSDGSTLAERAYVATGFPMTFEAIFEKNA